MPAAGGLDFGRVCCKIQLACWLCRGRQWVGGSREEQGGTGSHGQGSKLYPCLSKLRSRGREDVASWGTSSLSSPTGCSVELSRGKKSLHGISFSLVSVFHLSRFFDIEHLTVTRKCLFFLPENGPWKPSKLPLFCGLVLFPFFSCRPSVLPCRRVILSPPLRSPFTSEKGRWEKKNRK